MAQVPDDDRLARLEQVIARQQEQITRLEAALEQTVTPPAAPESAAAPPVEPECGDSRRARATGGGSSSRRALLQWGGAAAAAGVAVAASTLSGHTPVALAKAQNDGSNIVMGTSNTNSSATGTILTPAILSSPVVLLEADNASTLTSDHLHACGVKGTGPSGANGVIGVANGSGAKGVWGQSDAGIGVLAQSGSGYDLWLGGTGLQYQSPQGSTGAPTSGAHFPGESIRDGAGTLWLCVSPGTPGAWVRATTVANGAKGGAISYLSTPIRLLDARTSPGTALVTRGPLAGNETYAFTVAGLGGSGIPSNAQGLIANVTVLGPSGAGNLSLYPAGTSGPSVASMTFGTPGLFLANGVNVAIGSGGAINIQNQSSGTTPLVLDAVAFVS
jgi:hypothetical protein